MSYDYHGIIVILFLLFTLTDSCKNTLLNNITFGHIESSYLYVEHQQPKNISCSWIIDNEKQDTDSYYIISLRVIQLENSTNPWSNELILKTDNQQQLILNDINQRTFYLSSTSHLEIHFQTKFKSNNLHISRFSLEFSYINSNYKRNDQYFHCAKSGLVIPNKWQCNCLHECSYGDLSDEENCPLCSIIATSNSLLCHSNEIWCLPEVNDIDPNGVCIPSEQNLRCSYSQRCETIISYAKDRGEILLDNLMLSNRNSLCFVILAKKNYKLKLLVNQVNFVQQRPDLELFIYDGSEQEKSLLMSSNWLPTKQFAQTRDKHFATVVIRKRSSENINRIFYDELTSQSNILLNITWSTSQCPLNQTPCTGHFENKCYSTKQRCDGFWDCISGDDELGCAPASCPTTFACYDPLRLPSDRPRCYSWHERCNGNSYCVNRIDEKNCTKWWCNSNNGTFLCKNLNCVYEAWVCDGNDDCGDNSDEQYCPLRPPRRIIAAAVIGATICLTLFIIALGCTCKLLHLRSAEQRASLHLLNPHQYIQRRREERQQQQSNQTLPVGETSTDAQNDTQRLAPPSYNQTMGLSDDDEERHALLAEYLRLAGLDNYIPLSFSNATTRLSGYRNHRHRRHRRRRHHYHHQSHTTQNEDSHVAFLNSTSSQSTTSQRTSSANRFDRFRSRLHSLFTRNLSVNNNSILSNDFDSYEHSSPTQPIALSNRSRPQLDELPPSCPDDELLTVHHETDIQTSATIPMNSSTSTRFRIRKRQIPLNVLCDHSEEQPSTSSSSTLPVTTIEEDEQVSSDDDKLLMP